MANKPEMLAHYLLIKQILSDKKYDELEKIVDEMIAELRK